MAIKTKQLGSRSQD